MTTLASYAESFERFAAQLPKEQQAARRAQFERFLATGFPTPRIEEWHYTDLGPLAERHFELPAGAPVADIGGLLEDADRLVYVDGRLDAGHSNAARLHAELPAAGEAADGVAALNGAFATGGLGLRLGRGERLPRPLQVVALGAGGKPAMAHQRHRIELGENAEAVVVFSFLGGSAGGLATQVIEITLAAGARLTLYRLQDEHAEATLLTRIDARLGRDSSLHAVSVDSGSGLVRHDFNVDLAEPGAEAILSGLYQPAPGGHTDNHTRVVHSAPHCRSREYFRGVIDARAKAVFNGKVVVQPGAQKTDSEQHVANLLLSKKAEVNAKPELEIYADDVKCAHGATVGQLDDTALEYLRSRGIDAASARALLLRAFATEVLDRIALPGLRRQAEERLGLGAAEAPLELDA